MSTYIAFQNQEQVAHGPLDSTLAEVKKRVDAGTNAAEVLIFELRTGRQRDFDFRGSLSEVLERASIDATPARGRGRPKLGVTSKEITLLPRHWQWLAEQGKAPSATLRTMVEQAMRNDPRATSDTPDAEALWRMISAVGGNLPALEEVSRALFKDETERLPELLADWPEDLRQLLLHQSRGTRTADATSS